MRVLYISADNNRTSGAFLSMSTLCEKMEARHDVHVGVILPKRGDGKQYLDEVNIENNVIRNFDWVVSKYSRRDFRFNFKRHTESLWNYMSAIRICKYILNNEYDIVHINTIYSNVGMLAAKLAQRPAIWHIRELLEEDQNRAIWCKEKGYKLINEAETIITISDAVRDKYRNILEWNKICRIYNGVKTEVFYKKGKEIFVGNGRPIILFVGQLNRMKGCFDLIDACCLLNQKNIDFEVWFIGKESPEFESILSKSGIKDKAKCFGFISNVEEYYEKADITVMSSKAEAFGRVTVEAMLSGNLVIGSNTGGTNELIEHGLTGLKFKQGDTVKLAKTIEYALQHKSESRIIANSGRNFAFNNLSADRNCDMIYNEYEKVSNKQQNKSSAYILSIKIIVNIISPLCYATQGVIRLMYKAVMYMHDIVVDVKNRGIRAVISQKLKYLIEQVRESS